MKTKTVEENSVIEILDKRERLCGVTPLPAAPESALFESTVY
jgi:hypothetical protein